MSFSLSLLSLLVLATFAGCQPPCDEGDCTQPDPQPSTALRSGAWAFEVTDARLFGECQGMSPQEIVGQELRGELRVESPGPATLMLDGVRLQGGFNGRLLELTGALESPVEPHPGEPDPVEPGQGEDAGEIRVDGAEEPPCEVEPSPGGGGAGGGGAGSAGGPPPDIHLVAQALDARRLEGTLVVVAAMAGDRCTIEAEISGRHLEGGGLDRPVDPDDDRPVDDDRPDQEERPDGDDRTESEDRTEDEESDQG